MLKIAYEELGDEHAPVVSILIEFMVALQLSKAMFIGRDWGASVCYHTAALYPGRVMPVNFFDCPKQIKVFIEFYSRRSIESDPDRLPHFLRSLILRSGL